jgi:hypothetical protein
MPVVLPGGPGGTVRFASPRLPPRLRVMAIRASSPMSSAGGLSPNRGRASCSPTAAEPSSPGKGRSATASTEIEHQKSKAPRCHHRLRGRQQPEGPFLDCLSRCSRGGAHPEQPVERDTRPIGRPRVEGPIEIHQGGRFPPTKRRGQGSEQHGGAPVTSRPAQLRHCPAGPAAPQPLIERRHAGREPLALFACLDLPSGNQMRSQPPDRYPRGHLPMDT